MNLSICPWCALPGQVISKVKSAGEFWACDQCRRVTDSGDHNLTWSSEAQWEYLHDMARREVVLRAGPVVPVASPLQKSVADALLMIGHEARTVLCPRYAPDWTEHVNSINKSFIADLDAVRLNELAAELGVA